MQTDQLSDETRQLFVEEASAFETVRMIEIDPDSSRQPWLRLEWLKWLREEMGRTEESDAELYSAAFRFQAHHSLRSEVGHRLKDRGDRVSAVHAYALASEITPTCWACHYNRAWCLRDLERYQEAAPHVASALEHAGEKKSGLLWFLDADVSLHLGKPYEASLEQALAVLTQRITDGEEVANAYYWRAAVLCVQGKHRAAYRDLKKMFRMNPGMLGTTDWDRALAPVVETARFRKLNQA